MTMYAKRPGWTSTGLTPTTPTPLDTPLDH